MTPKVLIDLRNVRKNFGSVIGVDDVSLTVAEGEFVSLLGPSGCGKTTTLNLIAGFASADQGEILIAGKPVTSIPTNQRNLGMVFQSYALFPHLTVVENIRFGLRMRGIEKKEGIERSQDALAMVRLNGFAERRISELSGGQRQRVALARAIVTNPIALLLDEPLSALDANLREEMRTELREIQERTKIATVMVTHDQDEALALSDKVIVMHKGRIEQSGSPLDIYNSSSSAFVARFVGDSNLVDASVLETGPTQIKAMTASGLTVVARSAAGYQVGQPVKLSIRPESVHVSGETRFENQFTGRVDRVVFLGPVTKVDVVVDGQNISARLQNSNGPAQLRQGDEISIGWNSENVQVLHG